MDDEDRFDNKYGVIRKRKAPFFERFLLYVSWALDRNPWLDNLFQLVMVGCVVIFVLLANILEKLRKWVKENS